MSFRIKTLLLLNRYFPVRLKGDATFPSTGDKYKLSCIINFYKRTDLLRNILNSLADQNIGKDHFEVVLVEDRKGSPEGREIADNFKELLNISYYRLEKDFGVMGYARNFGLSKSSGTNVLFLDDDTVITDRNFIEKLLGIFDDVDPDVIVPRGISSYCIIKDKYQFHDPYYPTNRCTAYKKEALRELGGFLSDFIGQEDVEITVRLYTSGKKIHKTDCILYMHPPLQYSSLNKGVAVGYSFAGLYGKYPFLIWVLLLLNGCRYLAYVFFPFKRKERNQIKFSLGFLHGILNRLFGKKITNYS